MICQPEKSVLSFELFLVNFFVVVKNHQVRALKILPRLQPL